MLTLLLSLFSAQADEIKVKYLWESAPNIEICPESDITIKQVQKALDYWEDEINISYGSVKKVKKCSKKENTIQITDGINVDKSRHLALTTVSWYFYDNMPGYKFIDHAYVKFPIDFDYPALEEETFLHEMGHAFGLVHSDHPVMNNN